MLIEAPYLQKNEILCFLLKNHKNSKDYLNNPHLRL
jgi:hypothetical protein